MFDRLYVRVTEILIIVGLIVMVGITFTSTCVRIAGYGGIFWAEEVTRYTCIWLVFIASGLVIRYGVHFRVDFLVNALPRIGQLALNTLICLMMLGFEFVLIYYGGKITISNMAQQSTSLEFPMGYIYAAFPVGGVLMAVETVRALYRAYTTSDEMFMSEIQPSLVD